MFEGFYEDSLTALASNLLNQNISIDSEGPFMDVFDKSGNSIGAIGFELEQEKIILSESRGHITGTQPRILTETESVKIASNMETKNYVIQANSNNSKILDVVDLPKSNHPTSYFVISKIGTTNQNGNKSIDQEVDNTLHNSQDLESSQQIVGIKTKEKYACKINIEGYCIFTGSPHKTVLSPNTGNIVNRNREILFYLDEAVAVNSSGEILKPRGRPALDGDYLIKHSTDQMTDDERAFHKVMAIMFPIRNALMYDIAQINLSEWNEIVSELRLYLSLIHI